MTTPNEATLTESCSHSLRNGAFCADCVRALRSELAEARKERDAIRDSSFCTKCGWVGVPRPLIRGEKRVTLGWQCGNEACGYCVPEPKAATIALLTERVAELEQMLEGVCCLLPPRHDERRREALALLTDTNTGDARNQ